jgi:hypothetical protein
VLFGQEHATVRDAGGVVRDKISTHPDTLPTKIVEYKTRGISS